MPEGCCGEMALRGDGDDHLFVADGGFQRLAEMLSEIRAVRGGPCGDGLIGERVET